MKKQDVKITLFVLRKQADTFVFIKSGIHGETNEYALNYCWLLVEGLILNFSSDSVDSEAR